MTVIRFLIAVATANIGLAASTDCAPCHRAIYDRYRRTPMANSSGAVGQGLIRETFPQSFDHARTGFRYRVDRKPGAIALEFEKTDGTLKGAKELLYFVGSGAAARSYLISDDGFLYQAPVAY